MALKAALSKAVEWGLVEPHPLAKVKPSKVDTKAVVRFLSDDEERRLRSALDARDRRLREQRAKWNEYRQKYRKGAVLPELGHFGDHLQPVVLLAVNTGLRRGELFSLTWVDVDLGRAILTIRGHTAKSGTTRHVPLNAEALDVLRRWKAQTGAQGNLVFPAEDGERLNNVRKSWAGVLKAAGIRDFRFHDLRHHFASRLVMAGVDLYVVKELLGHSSIQMTERYSHLAPEHKAAAVARLVRRASGIGT